MTPQNLSSATTAERSTPPAKTVVYKYPFSINPASQTLRIEVPSGSEILSFDFQRSVPTVWLLIGGGPIVERIFVLFGTGHPLPQDKILLHVGSALAYGGDLVLHCFEDVS